ncbi:hypothetical protein DXV76_03520 [Rhodobacteraceae bacterium CCMM004]|nr:hypothetical protein DXV76_03520 [Rhodobacteraceae bacterium CCMM004]
MDHIAFMKHLRDHEARDPDRVSTARAYKNAAGIDELIRLPQPSWDYVDWLEAGGDINFAEWVLHCEANPCDGFTLSHLLMYWLWLDACRRYSQGLPTYSPHPPEGYETYAEPANDA